MASNMGGNMGQAQNMGMGGVNSMSGQQGLRTNLNTMEVDSPSSVTTHGTHHTMTNLAPSPNLGNLQSVVGSNNSSQISTTSHSPLATALQGGNTSNATSNMNLGAPAKSNPAMSAAQHHDSQTQIITRPRLHDLIREVDPTEQLDEEVEELLLQMADDFVESTVGAACLIAKHRKSNTIEIKDIQLHLERTWNMWVPGFGTDELRPYKRSSTTEAHKQRLALIRKALKKY